MPSDFLSLLIGTSFYVTWNFIRLLRVSSSLSPSFRFAKKSFPRVWHSALGSRSSIIIF